MKQNMNFGFVQNKLEIEGNLKIGDFQDKRKSPRR